MPERGEEVTKVIQSESEGSESSELDTKLEQKPVSGRVSAKVSKIKPGEASKVSLQDTIAVSEEEMQKKIGDQRNEPSEPGEITIPPEEFSKFGIQVTEHAEYLPQEQTLGTKEEEKIIPNPTYGDILDVPGGTAFVLLSKDKGSIKDLETLGHEASAFLQRGVKTPNKYFEDSGDIIHAQRNEAFSLLLRKTSLTIREHGVKTAFEQTKKTPTKERVAKIEAEIPSLITGMMLRDRIPEQPVYDQAKADRLFSYCEGLNKGEALAKYFKKIINNFEDADWLRPGGKPTQDLQTKEDITSVLDEEYALRAQKLLEAQKSLTETRRNYRIQKTREPSDTEPQGEEGGPITFETEFAGASIAERINQQTFAKQEHMEAVGKLRELDAIKETFQEAFATRERLLPIAGEIMHARATLSDKSLVEFLKSFQRNAGTKMTQEERAVLGRLTNKSIFPDEKEIGPVTWDELTKKEQTSLKEVETILATRDTDAAKEAIRKLDPAPRCALYQKLKTTDPEFLDKIEHAFVVSVAVHAPQIERTYDDFADLTLDRKEERRVQDLLELLSPDGKTVTGELPEAGSGLSARERQVLAARIKRRGADGSMISAILERGVVMFDESTDDAFTTAVVRPNGDVVPITEKGAAGQAKLQTGIVEIYSGEHFVVLQQKDGLAGIQKALKAMKKSGLTITAKNLSTELGTETKTANLAFTFG